jgi:tetratricopeptide (TPR) repeat protein
MRLFALFLVAAITLPASSAAGGTTQSTTPAPPASGSSTTPTPPPSTADQAREHYERGLAKYNLADFDAAISEFKQSYELSKAPRLLFNLAQAYRLKKDYESALYFYNSYLRADPNPPNLNDVENRIDEMKRARDEQRKQQAPLVNQPPPVKAVHVYRGPSKRSLKIMGLTVGTLGLVAAGVGGGMLGLASADTTKLKRVVSNGWTWSTADDAIYREGDRAQTAGIALVSVGGALVLAGGVTLVLALRR